MNLTKAKQFLVAFAVFCCLVYAVEAAHGANWQTYPEQEGGACSKVTRAATNNVTKKIVFPTAKTKYIRLQVPKEWKPGSYVCLWDVETFRLRKNERPGASPLGLNFNFYGTKSSDENYCIGRVTLEVPHFQYSSSFQFCRTTSERITLPNRLRLKLELNITAHSPQNRDDAFSITIRRASSPGLPKRFVVDEMITSNDSFIRDRYFSWADARKVCKNMSRRWDFCKTIPETTCSGFHWDHDSTDTSTRYYPVAKHNVWTTVRSPGCAGRDSSWPFPWGMDRSTCPANGCVFKSHIFCCYYNPRSLPKIFKKPVKWTLVVTSRISFFGQYHYNFKRSIPGDGEYDDDYLDYGGEYYGRDYYWMIGHWSSTAMIDGDVRRFRIFKHYTHRTPTAIFFCSTGRNEEEYNFMVSLVPCKHPWRYSFHGFAGNKQRKGLKPLYFGRSTKGGGTRVSSNPFCCGFDGEESFKVYGVLEDSWIHSFPMRCKKTEEIFSHPGGVISSELVITSHKFAHCVWKIRVQQGHGIRLKYSFQFDQKEVDRICHNGYLEFINPKTQQSFGRTCGTPDVGTFLSDSNALDVHFVRIASSIKANFSVHYTESELIATPPTKYKLKYGTWFRSKKLCEEKGMRLCMTNDICPLGILPAVDVHNTSVWVAVADNVNDWVRVWPPKVIDWRTYRLYDDPDLDNRDVLPCDSHVALLGPTDWGKTDRDEPLESCTVNCDDVFCCHRSSEIWGNSRTSPRVPEPVVVNVLCRDQKCENVIFARSEEMFETSSSFPSNQASKEVNYFRMASEYDTCFNQVIYFCRHEYRRYVSEMSRRPCQEDYVFQFHLYAALTRCKNATAKLIVGTSDANGDYACCDRNQDVFEVYVIGAGKVDVKNEE